MEEGAGEVRELGGWRRVGRKVGLEGWVVELDIRGFASIYSTIYPAE